MKLTWINFLHLYQPAAIEDEKVIEAAEKSYLRIIGALKRNKNIKFTLNISGCLLERLHKLGYSGLIEDIKNLIEEKRIELTGSSMHHFFLPLLPDEEIKRQISLNEKTLREYFGSDLGLNGFFIPEAAYGKNVAKLIKNFGYKWLMLDEIASCGKLNAIDYSNLYIDKSSGLNLCFRNRNYSNNYVPQIVLDFLKKDKNELMVTATDAELYGLRHDDFSANFEKSLKSSRLKTKTVSEYLNGLSCKKIISPIPSSWGTTEKELKKGQPYHLWQDKNNKIQTNLWKLAKLAINTVNDYKKDENYVWARQHLDKGLASCTFWWASAKDFGMFGPISWSPDEIERGANELIRSIRALEDVKTRKIKIQAEKLYIDIKKMIWKKHWNYYWKK